MISIFSFLKNNWREGTNVHMKNRLCCIINLNTGIIVFIVFGFLLSACSTAYKIKDGKTAYELMQYSVAAELFEKEYQNAKNDAGKSWISAMLGRTYLKLLDHVNAVKWFERAISHGMGDDILFEYAMALKRAEQYEKSISILESLRRTSAVTVFIDREISILRQVMQWNREPTPNVQIFPFFANSEANDYSLTLYGSEFLVITSDRDANVGADIYTWTGKKFSDLYQVNKFNRAVVPFDQRINTGYNEGTAVFTQDGSEMIFTRCFNTTDDGDEYCKLMFSRNKDGNWSEPIVLNFVKDRINYGQPALIENDEVLIFSAISEGGANGYDLFYSERLGELWSEPEPMPPTINTPGDERFPTADGDTLYFSSNYLPGFGGLDIFKTYLKSDNSWAPPVNLKKPFNSGGDDFGFVLDRRRSYPEGVSLMGYFNTTRESSNGDKIYEFRIFGERTEDINKPPLVNKPETQPPKSTTKATIFLAGKVYGDKYIEEGGVLRKVSGKSVLRNAEVWVVSAANDTTKFFTDRNGLFITEISPNTEYNIIARMPKYLNSSTTVNTHHLNIAPDAEIHTINTELILSSFEKGVEIVLENVYYDFDKWDIREDAKPALIRLASILLDNPNLSIELSAHTDCRGDDDYNLKLSEKRAESAVQFLMSLGIDQSRLTAKGYGESRPVNSCLCDQCTEDEHQANRRTSFVIL